MEISVLEYIIGGLLLVLAVALIWIIGAQQSKRKSGLSGSIAGNGASESYLSRNKIASKETSYKKATLIIAIVFVVLVIALYIIGSIPESDDTSENAEATVTESSTEETEAESSDIESSEEVSETESSEEVSETESSETESSETESSETVGYEEEP